MKYATLALFLSFNLSQAADDAASKKLLAEIEGVYTIAAAERAGSAPPGNFLEEIQQVAIKDGKLTITFKIEGKAEEKSAAIAVNAGTKPMQIDMTPEKDKTIPGILQPDGETLKVCWNDTADGKRPTAFTTSKEDKNFYLLLKRMKK